MTTGAPPRRDPSLRVPGLRSALGALAAVTLAGVALAVGLGPSGALPGVLLGTGLVATFFVLGSLTTAVAAAYAPGLALLVALLTYVLQVLLLGLALVAVDRAEPAAEVLQRGWLAGAVVAGTLTWVGALVIATLRTPVEPFGEAAEGADDASVDGRVRES